MPFQHALGPIDRVPVFDLIRGEWQNVPSKPHGNLGPLHVVHDADRVTVRAAALAPRAAVDFDDELVGRPREISSVFAVRLSEGVLSLKRRKPTQSALLGE